MAPIGLLPELDRASIVPLYRQIYEHLREAILAGTLPESTRLPPERSLAEKLNVNRSTVVHAYRELVADGLIEQRVGSGSRVVPQLRGGQPERSAGVPWWVTLPPWRVGEFPNVLGELAAKQESGRISFVQGVAPDEPSPLAELAKSFGRVAHDPRFVLSYGDSEGYEPLRSAIAARMNARGAASVTPNGIIVLTGSTQGIAIVAQSLAEPGDEIIVESPSYPGALQVFQINGLRAIPVQVDEDGMRVDHVEAVLRTRRPRFIYTMPSLHNPTNATMNADRRERLATIAKRAGVPIVEDDPYGELAPDAGPPLVALAPDHVVYLSTFSKTIAPSLRVGWLAAPRTILERLLLRKQAYDMATSLYVQAAVTDYLERGYDAHVDQLRDELQLRRSLADDAIAEHWPAQLRATGPSGGFYLWVTTPREVRARALLDAAERRGASFLFGEAFFVTSGGDHHLRLALTAVTRKEIGEGIRRIGDAVTALRPQEEK
ncbi:MAG: PLP-dependent aminotransferase family protein [Candidatus Eremiobacteraeota bacterium]|nr:PLP-dependent aminotransferase family protein [Candidatus Eremiobacteraeota bacterium]MBV8583711.1 PLP-dependent aminotransferase family protein [Candidatus Eremiobacteraeota bacterium]